MKNIFHVFLQVQFTHWMDGEPNNKNNVESCAEARLGDEDMHGSWNDVHCELYKGWLCQIRAGKISDQHHSFVDYQHFKKKNIILLWKVESASLVLYIGLFV